jgi:uncharacterized protein involved in exopolysaccharide biosynthesis
MEDLNQNINSKEEDISLKELVLKVQEWWRYFLRKWLIILIFGLVGAILGLIYSIVKPVDYVGELTFVLEDNKSSPLSAYVGIASQFGLDLSGGGDVGVFSGDNILEFLKSRLLVEKSLLSPIILDNKTISLAELYVDTYKLRENWSKKIAPENIKFAPNTERKLFSRLQDSLLNELYQAIINKNLDVTKPDKKLSFISVSCASRSEAFSKLFVERLVKEATEFYVETKTKRSRVNVSLLQNKADSLESLLNQKTYSTAVSQDLNQNLARKVATVNLEVASRDKLILQTMYGEVIKNLELSKMTMAQEMPLIQTVDTPILPLKQDRLGKLKALLIGGILGGFIVCIMLGMRKLYLDIMSN